jgi:hypothetical protein
VLFSIAHSSGKVYRFSTKSNEGSWLQTIRVNEVLVSSSVFVFVLGVHNRRSRIFGTLHPEPLLKLATPKVLLFEVSVLLFLTEYCKTGIY